MINPQILPTFYALRLPKGEERIFIPYVTCSLLRLHIAEGRLDSCISDKERDLDILVYAVLDNLKSVRRVQLSRPFFIPDTRLSMPAEFTLDLVTINEGQRSDVMDWVQRTNHQYLSSKGQPR